LRLLLLTPKGLIDVAALITPFNMALRLGLSYPPLAVAALDGTRVLGCFTAKRYHVPELGWPRIPSSLLE